MGLGTFWCYVWWLTLGALGGWLLWWLLDKLFLRDTETPAKLASAERELDDRRRIDAKQQADHQAELASLRSEIETERSARSELEKAYESEYNKVVAEHDGRVRELSDATKEIARLKSELVAAGTRTASTDQSLAEATQRIAGLEAVTAQKAALTGDLEKARALITKHEAEISRLAKSLATTEARNAEWALAAAQNASEIASLKGAIESARAGVDARSMEIERLKSERERAGEESARIAQLVQDVEARDERIRRFEAEIEEHKGVLLGSRDALERKTGEIERLRGELAAAQGQKSELATLRADLGKAQALAERVRALEAEASDLRASEQRQREELARSKARVDNLERMRAALEASRRAAEEHANEVARLNRELFESINAGSNEPKDGGKS